MATSSNRGTHLSREDYRKQKELDELRKSGAAMPELDEEGRMINPHIPQYISRTPWYYESNVPSLRHQTSKLFQDTKPTASGIEGIKKVEKQSLIGQKWRKGSCENCGSLTHTKKNCFERPRKMTARQANVTLGDDIKVHQPNLDFAAQHDHWHDDDGSTYQEVIDRYKKIDNIKRQAEAQALEKQLKEAMERDLARQAKKEEKLQIKIQERKKAREERRILKRLNKKEKKLKQLQSTEAHTESDNQTKILTIEDIKDEDVSPIEDVSSEVSTDVNLSDDDVGTKKEANSDDEKNSDDDIDGLRDDGTSSLHLQQDNAKQTMRSLRIREDTAKYLRNLDVNSAYYDPKTRALRDNPYGEGKVGPDGYRGDTFLRESGLVQERESLEIYANTVGKTTDQRFSAFTNPSAAEESFKDYQKQKEQLRKTQANELDDIYGSVETTKPLVANVILGQSEQYAEYDTAGNLLKGQAEIIPKSKYIEDQLEVDHTQIWGSYYDFEEKAWGYGCCKQTTRNICCLAHIIPTKSTSSSLDDKDKDLPKRIKTE